MIIFQSVSKSVCFAYNREHDSLATATIFWTKPNPCQKLRILSDFASGWLLRCCDFRAVFFLRDFARNVWVMKLFVWVLGCIRVSYEIIRGSFVLYSWQLWGVNQYFTRWHFFFLHVRNRDYSYTSTLIHWDPLCLSELRGVYEVVYEGFNPTLHTQKWRVNDVISCSNAPVFLHRK